MSDELYFQSRDEGPESVTDEILINWREANEYLHEGEENKVEDMTDNITEFISDVIADPMSKEDAVAILERIESWCQAMIGGMGQ